MIYHAGYRHTIRQGHVLTVLREIAEKSVNLIVTSPPYYGLRSYGGDAIVWDFGGEYLSANAHVHDWKEVVVANNNTGGGLTPKQKTNRGSYSSDSYQGGDLPRKGDGFRGFVCGECECGASLGHLGQESQMDCGAWARQCPPCNRCYVCRLRAIMSGVQRVLHPSGSLWLNLGDSYAAQGGAQIDGTKQTPGSQAGAWDGKSRRPAGGIKPKNLYGVPWRVALALQADGWILRNAVPWVKGSAMPESCNDRYSVAHEYWFLLTRSPSYFWDEVAVRMPFSEVSMGQLKAAYKGKATKKYAGTGAQDPSETKRRTVESMKRRCGRNHRTTDLWRASMEDLRDMVEGDGLILGPDGEVVGIDCANGSYAGEHFATYSPHLIAPFIKAGTSPAGRCAACRRPLERHVDFPDDQVSQRFEPSCKCNSTFEPCVVLDPFLGSGTTMEVALLHGCEAIGIELNPDYCKQAMERAGRVSNAPVPAVPRAAPSENYREMRRNPPAFRLPGHIGEETGNVLDGRDSLLASVGPAGVG